MSKPVRIIPRLDIKGPNLVKGIRFEGLRVLGSPDEFARYYYANGADELMYVDVVASLYERNSLHDLIAKTAREIFIPLTVSGGIRSIDDIRDVLRAGADKVSINTAAIINPEIIKEAARLFGSSTIVVSIEAIKQPDGRYLAFTDNGREYTGVDALEWAVEVASLGAGEIVVSAVDREGTGEGYDVALTKMISAAVNIPVVAHGGPGTLEHLRSVVADAGVDAVAVASMLHYGFLENGLGGESIADEGNTEFLRSGKKYSRINHCSIGDIKNRFYEAGIPCRL